MRWTVSMAVCLSMTCAVSYADERCPEPTDPFYIGDEVMAVEIPLIDQLPSLVREQALDIVPDGYVVFSVFRSSYSLLADPVGAADYWIFFNNQASAQDSASIRRYLVILQWSDDRGRFYLVMRSDDSSQPAYINSGDPVVGQRPDGTIYARTIGFDRGDCWENIIYWSEDSIVADQFFYNVP